MLYSRSLLVVELSILDTGFFFFLVPFSCIRLELPGESLPFIYYAHLFLCFLGHGNSFEVG